MKSISSTDIARELRNFADEQEQLNIYDCRNLATDSLRAYADMLDGEVTDEPQPKGKSEPTRKTSPVDDKSPLVSVVVPCYNCQSTVSKMIQSIQRQSRQTGWEVILVDDHSTDHTVETITRSITSIQTKTLDPRFKFMVNPFKGAGSARNFGMQKSSGNYLWFMDSDDFIAGEDVFQTVLNTVTKNPNVDLFTVNCTAVDERGAGIRESFTNQRAKPEFYGKFISNGEFVKNFEKLYPVIGFAPWNKIVRRGFLNEHRILFQNTPFGNDQYFSIRCMVESQSTYLIPGDPVYCWLNAGRFHTSNSVLKKNHPEVYEVILKGLERDCKWPNPEMRKKVLRERRERFEIDTRRINGLR